MYAIQVHNVNQGLAQALRLLSSTGAIREESRNGPVLVMSEPVVTTYEDPTCRVLFSPRRNANPYFHLMEALWMMGGRNDLAWPVQFNKRFAEYSDDGHTLHGAYGHRWREHFGHDQLAFVIDELQRNPKSRRAVVAMWDPSAEATAMAFGNAKDVPCNTTVYFDTLHDRLNMTVCCRSNDIWWGCYGANAVHFSIMMEYVAAGVRLPVGHYRQLSNNFHVYTDVVAEMLNRDKAQELSLEVRQADRYTYEPGPHAKCLPLEPGMAGLLKRVPLIKGTVVGWDMDLERFLDEPTNTSLYREPFFNLVAKPMYQSWAAHKAGNYGEAIAWAEKIGAGDWGVACIEWLDRIEAKRQARMMEE